MIPITEDEVTKFVACQIRASEMRSGTNRHLAEIAGEARRLARLMLASEQMYEALKDIEPSSRHAPCYAGGYDGEGVCPNSCVCKVGHALAAAEGRKA